MYPSVNFYLGKFVTIGKRLKEEREKLGLNQTDFAGIGGVGRKSQFNYEEGERQPDASYLVAIAGAGVDVLYVLTGQRGVAPAAPLPPDEAALLDNYRHSPEHEKRLLRETSAALAKCACGMNRKDAA